ncbi:hypothetical protein Ahia01_000135600 [Argonauta hians]
MDERKDFKEVKNSGYREKYVTAKREAKRQVYIAKQGAQDKLFDNVACCEDEQLETFHLAKESMKDNKDVVGDSYMKDDCGKLALTLDKKETWKCHYERMMNVENECDQDESLTILVSLSIISKAIKDTKLRKATGPSGISAEMLKAPGDIGAICSVITCLVNQVIQEGTIPHDWCNSTIVSCFKGKDDALGRNNYKGIKLLDQVMKITERVFARLIRDRVQIDDMQFSFMPDRSTADAILLVRQLQETYLEKNKPLYLAFVDLEKAFDNVSR